MARKNRKAAGIGEELIESMQEALAYMRGEKTNVRVTRVDAPSVEIKRIRKKVGLTQETFATALGVSVSGLRKWEQGQRHPHGAALTLLHVMDKEPEAVIRAISAP